jgi:hypothetical protein
MSSVRNLREHDGSDVLHVHRGQTERAPLAIARQEDSLLSHADEPCHAVPIRSRSGVTPRSIATPHLPDPSLRSG